jgi:hypothetical protein
MRALILVLPLLTGLAGLALAQPAAQPPPATQPADDRPSALLRAAQNNLAAGRINDAREALEMAQTRLLDRSVPLGQTRNPSDNAAVGEISQALQALAARDRATCMQWIDTAMTTLTAQGL